MDEDSAHKSRWEIAEVVFGIPFLISIALQFILPIAMPQGILRRTLIFVGIALILIAIGLIVLARRELASHAQPTDPGHPTSQLVRTGVFSISRNPLYLGGALSILGIALALELFWAIPMLLLSLVLCHYILIIPEEKYLAAKFGDEYTQYTRTVRRWLGRK